MGLGPPQATCDEKGALISWGLSRWKLQLQCIPSRGVYRNLLGKEESGRTKEK
jgi:hypothetical protein